MLYDMLSGNCPKGELLRHIEAGKSKSNNRITYIMRSYRYIKLYMSDLSFHIISLKLTNFPLYMVFFVLTDHFGILCMADKSELLSPVRY